jgi:M6 family metalloprotease-like protein
MPKKPTFFYGNLQGKKQKAAFLAILVIAQVCTGASSTIADSTGINFEACKLAKIKQEPLSAGFPRDTNLLASKGKIRNLFLFVDFPDNKSTFHSKDFANNYFKETKKFLEDQSYGQISLELFVSNKVFRVEKNSESYKLFSDGQGDMRGLIQDAISAADKELNFSNYDLVTLGPPANTKTILSGGALTGGGDLLVTAEKSFSSAILIGKNKLSDFLKPGFGWNFYSHEFGHVLGITHPYKYQEGKPGAIWDLMGNGGTSVPEFLGWHRSVLGWLGKEETICKTTEEKGSFQYTLKPLNSKEKGPKFLITQISPTRALALEVRRESRFDKLTAKETGVLVYLVDITKGDDQGIITVISNNKTKKDNQILGSLKPGDRVNFEGKTIQVVASKKSGDSIKVTL